MVLEAAGGGGSGRYTNWQEKDVPAIWAAIGGMVVDPIWTHSTGWTKTSDLTNENLFRLKDFRSKLAEAWPPEKSEAAKAYITKLDELISNVEDVYEAAQVNKQSCVDIAWTLSDAKRKVEPLYNEYQTNLGKQSAYDQALATQKSTLLTKYGSTSSTGYKNDMTRWTATHPDPATASRQDQITQQARSVMWSTSTDLSVAQSKMVEPPMYTPPQGRYDEDSTSSGSSGSVGGISGVVPPFIPAPVPLPIGPMPTGPILSGTTPPTTTLPTPIGSPPVIGAPPIPSGPVGLPVPGVPGMPIPPGGVIGVRPGGGVAGVPGVIGARPGATGSVIGGARAPMGRAVNPVGGVIGGAGGRGAAAQGAGRRGSAGMPLGGAGRLGRKDRDGEGRDWDPDNPWEVAEGVAPVVDAPGEWGPVDPGPSIGGRG